MTSLMTDSGRLNGQWPCGNKSQFIRIESDRDREREMEGEGKTERKSGTLRSIVAGLTSGGHV